VYSFDDAIRRAPLLQLLFKKRRQHRLQVEMMKSKKHLLKIPPISEDQVRAFLLADDARLADPFTAHIERHLAVVAADEAAEQAAGLGGEELGRPRSRGGNPLMLLLQSLSGEDCVQALLDVTESFRRTNVKRVRKLSAPANSVETTDPKVQPEMFALPSPSPSLHAVAASPSSSRHGHSYSRGPFAVEPEPSAVTNRLGQRLVAQSQHSEISQSQSRGCWDPVEVTDGVSRKSRLQSLALTVDDAAKVLRKLDAISVRRPSFPRPSTAGKQRHGSIFESPRKSVSNYVEGSGYHAN